VARRKPIKWSNDELVTKMRQAKAFEDPIVQDYLDMTEERLFENWRNSKSPEERETLYLQCLGIAAFRKFVEETVILGNMAEAEIAKKLNDEQTRKGQ